ncbi:MAG: hypothetical protein OXC15_05225 [Rhodospirillaceae bacterium]|nr:hypothetical protein [Rhodospirillaceae bacterium]
MPYEMRLFEDTLFGGEEVRFDGPAPRAIYVSAGSVSVNGENVPLDGGVVSTDAATVRAGGDGATVWRWEVGSADADADACAHRTSLRLAGRVDPAAIAEELLIRLDSVAFPPGGTALLHTHQGPGIRCLREGEIRINTEGRSSSYGPGGAWFESGPEPVFAQASMAVPSRFIRTMVLPRSLLGASSIRYVNIEDRDKPKSQSYRVFAERPIELALA